MPPPDSKQLLRILEDMEARIEYLEAHRLKDKATIHGLLMCLRDLHPEQRDAVLIQFKEHSAEVHQRLLERVEDFDAWLAARWDKR